MMFQSTHKEIVTVQILITCAQMCKSHAFVSVYIDA